MVTFCTWFSLRSGSRKFVPCYWFICSISGQTAEGTPAPSIYTAPMKKWIDTRTQDSAVRSASTSVFLSSVCDTLKGFIQTHKIPLASGPGDCDRFARLYTGATLNKEEYLWRGHRCYLQFSVCFGNLKSPSWCKSSSERLFKAEFSIRGTQLRWRAGESFSFSISASHYSKSLLLSWPSWVQRIKERRDIWQNTRQPRSAWLRLLYIYTQRGACAHTWTQRITFVLRQHVHLKHANNESLKN